MKTRQQFILDTLKPYFIDPSTCGYNGHSCVYLTDDGRKCAFGKHMKNPTEFGGYGATAFSLLNNYGTDILTDEAQAQNLTPDQWLAIQQTHDSLARGVKSEVMLDGIQRCERYCEVDLSELKELVK